MLAGHRSAGSGPYATDALPYPDPIASNEPTVVVVETFNDAQAVGDSYRAGNVVDLVIENTDPDVARRVVDFATGLVYGGRGSMYRIGDYRYRVEPAMPRSDRTGP